MNAPAGAGCRQVQQLYRAVPRLLLGEVFMDLNRLDDLVADAVHRVQTREWVLEDHRQVLAAHGLQLVPASFRRRPMNTISPETSPRCG